MALCKRTSNDPRANLATVGITALLILGLTSIDLASAEDLPKESVLPLGMANEAIQAAMEVASTAIERIRIANVSSHITP